MNRRQKIIVSVVGIFIVLLALVGITYGYFLTRIQGNTNTTSVSVTTAKLELVYGDNSAEIIRGTGALMPSTDLTSAGAIGTKTFTVTNNGNDSSYVVVIDNVSIIKASDGSSTSFVSNDFRYTLSCKKSDNTDCNNVSDLTIFPIKGGILVSNDIEEDDVHTYTLTMWYIDTGVDQSDDMGKSLQARVNIADVAQMENPFMTGVTATDNASLAYNIIKNAKDNKNGTRFVNTPLTNPAETISGVTNYKTTGEDATFAKSMSSVSSNASKTWYYYDTYEVNATTGKFTLSGKHSCTYKSTTTNTDGETVNCYDDMVNKYLYNTSASNNSNANNHTADTKTDLSNVYKVTSATATTLNYVQVFNSPNEAERVLAPTTDDYGTSYYYRGYVKDNYVNFAGMCWRIVRIDGLGNTKLILEDAYAECNDTINNDKNNDNIIYTGAWNIPASDGENLTIDTSTNEPYKTGNFGYNQVMYDDGNYRYLASYLNSVVPERSMVNAFKYFQKTNLAGYTDKLTTGNWCYNDTAYCDEIGTNIIDKQSYYNSGTTFYYDSYVRLIGDGNIEKNPTLKCNGTVMNKYKDNTDMLVSALTADEIMFAGGKFDERNQYYYLINNYQFANSKSFWSLSPNYSIGNDDSSFRVNYDGRVYFTYVSGNFGSFRPAVSLESGVGIVAGGDGTKTNPYEIEA